MSLYGKFTQKAQQALLNAKEEAVKFRHNYIGTEHLLIGLVMQNDNVVSEILAQMNIDEEYIRVAILSMVGNGEEQGPILGYTPRMKRVLEESIIIANELNQSYVGSEHLLLGLLKEGNGVAANILLNAGVNFASVKEKVVAKLSSGYKNSLRNAVRRKQRMK